MKKLKHIILAAVSLMLLNINLSAQKPGYKIYFSLRESPGQNIKIMSYNGKSLNQYKIQNNRSSRGENQPSVSANGKFIGFNSYHFGGWKAAIADADGSGIRLVDKSGNYSFNPSFSSDGKTILFAQRANGRTGTRDIYTIGADGKGKKRLTKDLRNSYSASFSPDDSKIVFVSSRDLHYEIYVMNADGSNHVNVSNHGNHDANPSWSPDGKQIAFMSIREGTMDLFLVNADGSNLRNLTKNPKAFTATADSVDEMSYMYGTSWSPDGKSIVFVKQKEGLQKLYVINADGTGLRELVSTKGQQFNPFWAE
ncbi:MAG: hypothetical protein HEP71_05130 [Roseivirga sp.]|nr:hypothetical protein [Roseivirga sp.]